MHPCVTVYNGGLSGSMGTTTTTMKTILVILASLVASAVSQAPRQPPGEQIAIVSYENNLNPDGSYRWSYEAANGIKADETGTLKKAQNPEDGNVVVAQGGFQYTAPDGTPIQLTYVADDVGGFVPQGNHLPTPPPVPPAIQKAVEYLLSLPSTTEGPGRGRR